MEEKQERVFAYHLAKTISNDDLKKVSGGSADLTSGATVSPTGGSGLGLDTIIDVACDW
jgi:bacteriocin-like protein